VQAEAPLGATTETGHVHPFIKLFAPKKVSFASSMLQCCTSVTECFAFYFPGWC
jgi:hypothetical protein